MDDVVMRVDGVSKKFTRRIRHSMLYGTADVARGMLGMPARTDVLRPGEFWAVEDVSFELKKGETLGLIGPNGSGKSTLLRLLNGIFQPDKGRIEIMGRVGALIAVGAGFHPLMTGRENIYLNGSILGMTKAEIDRQFDSIVDFADIGDFLDAPVKTYSSGMYVRLGFAIAVHCEPDILLVDEVLAVGDFKFRQKCLDRINTMRKDTSVVFVSHNLREVSLLCDRSVYLEDGRAEFAGRTSLALEHYIASVNRPENLGVEGINVTGAPFYCGEVFVNGDKVEDVRFSWVDEKGARTEAAVAGRPLAAEFSFRLKSVPDKIVVAIPVWSRTGEVITRFSTDMHGHGLSCSEDGYVRGRLVIQSVTLNPGRYYTVMNVKAGPEYLCRIFAGAITVSGSPVFEGYFTPDHGWELEDGALGAS